MLNTYLYSTVTFRTKPSPCYSSNDYYLFNNRTSSCTCCVFPFNGVPLNPSIFYGLRQSTLIQWSASKRLILSGGGVADRFQRLPTSNFDRFCCQCCCSSSRGGNDGRNGCMGYENSCKSCDQGTEVSRASHGGAYRLKEKEKYIINGSTSRRRGGQGRRFKCMVWEEKDDGCVLGVDETMEAMLGLLAEEQTENCVSVKERRSRLAARKVQEERREINGFSKKERSIESDGIKRGSKVTSDSVTKIRERDRGSLEKRGNSLRIENRYLTKDGSSCSSYYSALSPDEIDMSDVDKIDESDLEVQAVKHGRFSSESSSRNKKDLRRRKEDIHVENVIKQSKQKEDNSVGYTDVSTQRNSVTGSTRVGIGSDHRLRNVREKKVTGVSIHEGESRRESVKRSSEVVHNHESDTEMTIAAQNRFRYRGNNSASSTYSVDATEECDEQEESRREFLCSTEKLEVQDMDMERVSNSQTQLNVRKENLSAPANFSKEEKKTDRQAAQVIGQNESSRKSQQLSRVLERHDTNVRVTSASERQFESTLKNREEISTSSAHMAAAISNSTDQRVVCETKSTRQSQDLSNVSVISDGDKATIGDSQNLFETRMNPQEEISVSDVSRMSKNHDNEIRRTSTSQRFSGSSLKSREESSNSLWSSFHKTEDLHQHAQRFVSQAESPRDSHDRSNISATSVSDMMLIGDSQPLGRRPSPQAEHLASCVDLVKDVREGKTQQASEHDIKQLESRKEPKRPTERPFLQESSADMTSSAQQLRFSQGTSEQQMGERERSRRNSRVMLAPLPSQIVQRTSEETIFYQESTGGNTTDDVYSELSGSEYKQETTPSSRDELNSETRTDNIDVDQSKIMFHEDALGSANRLEESSSQFVRQFVENLSHEVSASKLPEEKLSLQTTSFNKDIQQSLNQQVPENVHSKVQDSGRSLSRSGARGPSDEMWDVAGPFAEIPARTDAPARTEAPTEDTSISKSAIVKSGRSLWNIFGDIVRVRWGTRSEIHHTTAKSGGKSSSNESGGSEAWFSSHEIDEKEDENVKKGRRSMPKAHGPSGRPSLVTAGTQSLGGASEGISSNSKVIQNEVDTSSSLDTAVGHSASLFSKEELTSQQFDERSGQGIPSRNRTVSASPSRQLIRSPAVNEEIAESGKPLASRSTFTQTEQPLREIPIEGPGTEVKDGELKRRKLHRNKQVETETFEEWEEAYRIESEQRKIDEMFMKEALLEAKKAADTWEVPVGAVLVQHGKIIARGYNLVEDSRDSTAHAEMICIREASKILRTWRLAETTLYVTLEPCAMCAGAILQARVDTVVWGAPNKLLGADGSWVRLFPGGGEVGSTSELSSQSAGPVHPFHPKITVRRGILATECADIMQQFFQLRRKKNKRLDTPPTSTMAASTHPSKLLAKMHDVFGIMFCL